MLYQKYHCWFKEQTFISHSSGGWEVQDQGAGRFGVWWETTSWFIDGISHCNLTWGKWWAISLGFPLIRALLILFMRTLFSQPYHLPKIPPPNTVTLGVTLQHTDLWGHKDATHRSLHVPVSLDPSLFPGFASVYAASFLFHAPHWIQLSHLPSLQHHRFKGAW